METDKILLGHGSGGKLSHNLIDNIFLPYFNNDILARMEDAAVLTLPGQKLAFTTDSYVVDPIIFPGGDIGKIAVCGTVNDLAVMGAVPRYLSVGFIIEEGFPVNSLRKILESMQKVADEAKIQIVTGDTKVVPNGAADKIFINTSGVGLIAENQINLGGNLAADGDHVIINGSIADHGIAVMASREGLELEVDVQSDAAPLNDLIQHMLKEVPGMHVLRDPTRGGLATTLNEIAQQSSVGINIDEGQIPISQKVQSVCEILGLDPLYLANEGKCVAICPSDQSRQLIAVMRKHKYGKEARVIGRVEQHSPGKVFLQTEIGGRRLLDMLSGEQFPRIC
jgi:hydrogenase expression/formation protein HypE